MREETARERRGEGRRRRSKGEPSGIIYVVVRRRNGRKASAVSRYEKKDAREKTKGRERDRERVRGREEEEGRECKSDRSGVR